MIDPVARIVSRFFSAERGELRIEGLPASALAEQYGTPLFVYSRAAMEAKLAAMRSALPPSFSVYYSVKANPNPALLRIFLQHGCGLEIASAGEFHAAVSAGCTPAQIIFAGPGKTPAELEYVIAAGIGEIHAESLTELGRISEICARLNTTAHVGLRVNPTSDAEGGAMRMGGKPAPFGIDEEELDSALAKLRSDSRLKLAGVHVFAGTQILDAALLLSQFEKGLQLGRRVAAQVGRPLSTIDFGGGWGIPYFPADAELDLQALRAGVERLFAPVASDPLLAGTRFVVEPGRFLVGESGVYLTRVLDVKVSKGKKFVIVDGGMNHHLAASGNLGQTIKRNFPVAIANKLLAPAAEMVDVVGPLCTPLDVLARSSNLPAAEIGDTIAVFASGAYARSASPLGFLSHVTPAEVLVEGSESRCIRRRGTFADWLRDAEATESGSAAVHANKAAVLP